MPILIRGELVSPGTFSNEQELEHLLANYPDLLRADEEDNIAFVARQVDLIAGKLDLLFVTTKGLPIVVEVKLARNAESRREVVAQAIDYLSSLTALTVDELDTKVSGKLKAALGKFEYDGDDSESSFDLAWKAVGTNLRTGQARLIVVLDGANAGLERIFHFLARNSKQDVQLFTVQRYTSKGGDQVFVPRILVNPATEDDVRGPVIPHKSFEELLSGCTNLSVVEFFREWLGKNPPPKTNSHNNALAYPASGKIRWYVSVDTKKGCARVNQIGRFQDDELYWNRLSARSPTQSLRTHHD